MAEIIRMPKMSDTMEEGVIASWLKKVGDEIKSGDILAEVETDKATMELESYDDGVLLHVGVKDGDSVPVDGVIAIIGEKGEDVNEILEDIENDSSAVESNEEINETKIEQEAENKIPAPAPAPVKVEENTNSNDDRIKASPLAKKLADEKGVNLSNIIGSGDGGRIIRKDIEEYKHSSATKEEIKEVSLPQIYSQESFEEIPVTQMRKTISKRLAESKFSAPHFYLTMEIDMDNCIEGRKKINETSEIKISFNDIILKACAVALRKHPMVNSSFLTDKIRINHHVHIGVAVGVSDGLVVPVIKFADNKSITEIGSLVKNYANKAREKKLTPDEMQGSTFTISNLGMFGIQEFTSIINQPNSAILSVGSIIKKPIVKDDKIVIGNTIKLTLACDHRTVDGVTGSLFLETLKGYVENPVTMLV